MATVDIGSTETAAPICPRCRGSMVLREAKQGPHRGNKFYGCKRFPLCRAILPYKDARVGDLGKKVQESSTVDSSQNAKPIPQETIPLTDRQRHELVRLR